MIAHHLKCGHTVMFSAKNWDWMPVFCIRCNTGSYIDQIGDKKCESKYEAAKAKQVADSVDLDCSRGGCPIR